ncbi:MAG: hypothetical protein HY819_06575 [Acidobacteria bacterium]|nr:hypothetical protein [Acidobacteriota bacterium]
MEKCCDNLLNHEWSLEELASMESTENSFASDNVAAINVPLRLVSGRYVGQSGQYRLELRVDIDGKRPMKRISGDLYKISGLTVIYEKSFIVNSPTITIVNNLVTIAGLATFSSGITLYPHIKVTIPRVSIFLPASSANVVFHNGAGVVGSSYVCAFQSNYFRTVQYEQDKVQGITPFSSYNTGALALPPGAAVRTLTVKSAYAEAGIDVQYSGSWNTVSPAGAGTNSVWSNAELHAAMQAQFSLWADIPQWKVWLLAATRHEMDGVRGIMFDQQSKQRQGCAVFHDLVGSGAPATPPDVLRAMLRTYIHELGHCFNLLHSWQKSLATPPIPDRVNALSWMNYPQNYPGGTPAYWNAFDFAFDKEEIIHLRHGFRNNVIMGGSNFTVGSADISDFDEVVEDLSGLELRLETQKSFLLGEPVVVDIRLRTTDERPKTVHNHLHPNKAFVQIAISKPNGQLMFYEPLVEHCMDEDNVTLDKQTPSIYSSAYIGYGKGGFYFDQGGFYKLRAVYHALDGSKIWSDVITVRVKNPLTSADEEVADLFFGDDQGTLFYLLGSDSDSLKGGNSALDEVINKYAKHPLTVYAKLVKGINASRAFKTIDKERNLLAREVNTDDCIKSLTSVINTSYSGIGVDNITLNMVSRRLATVQRLKGDDAGAKTTLDGMKSFFKTKNLKAHVLELVDKQIAKCSK